MTRKLENMTIDELVDRFAEIGIAPMSSLLDQKISLRKRTWNSSLSY
jgi:hypothetical protein